MNNTRTNGFTILELILYMGILSLISVILANSYIALLRGRGQAETRSDVNANLRLVVDRIASDVKNANAIVLPSSAGSSGGTLQLTRNGVTVTYDTAAGRVRRATSTGEFLSGPTVSVNTLSFTRIENYHSVLRATTTGVFVVVGLRATSTSGDWSYGNTIETALMLR